MEMEQHMQRVKEKLLVIIKLFKEKENKELNRRVEM